MRILIKEKLSEHKSKTPEGYLICQDAILARTGEQDYLMSEIYEDFDGEDRLVKVKRNPEQVFSSEALASFEDKPITVEHPDESVGPDNYSELAVGHTRNIRKSTFNGQDVMIGDLVITDAQTIEDIENGIRTELSCGYDCDITSGDNPEQINIRGNHIALCEEGRAGIAKIIDSKPVMDSSYYIGFLGEKEKERLKEGCKKYNCKFDVAGYEDGMADCFIIGAPEDLEKVVKGYTYKNFYRSEVNDAFNVKDMAMSRTDAMELCLALGKVFIGHFDKLYKDPENDAAKHWGIEMKDKFDKVSNIILKHNNKPILGGNLRDWFFTAGANPENFMNNPTDDELAAYDKFVNELLNGGDFVTSLNKAVGKEIEINDVKPRKDERKDEFISRFMEETEKEYPDRKQRFAVANSYWERRNMKDEKIESLPAKERTRISKFFNSISTFTHGDTDVMKLVVEPLRDMGYEPIRESIDGWKKMPDGEYIKDYTFSIDGYRDQFLVRLYADPYTWEVKECLAYFTGKRPSELTEDTEDVRIEDEDEGKYAVYKSLGKLYVTPLKNYNARIQNAREIHEMAGFDTVEEVIEYLMKWFKLSREDIVTIGDELVGDVKIEDEYSQDFYKKYVKALEKNEKKLRKENFKETDDELDLDAKHQRFNIYKEIKAQIEQAKKNLAEE